MDEIVRRPYKPETEEEEAAAEKAVEKYMMRYRSHILNDDSENEKYAAFVFTDAGTELICRYKNKVMDASFDLGVFWADLARR